MTTRTIEAKAVQVSRHGSREATPPRRTIGYCIANSSVSTSNAILYFYPLGICSEFVLGLAPALSNISAKMIAVDRPGCADTSWEDKQEKEDAVMRRIHTHARDVLQVLQEESIQRVYVLCACIGHAYGMEVCKRLMETKGGPQLEAITLVAPFVSTACPAAWRVARFGHCMPAFVLHAANSVKASVFPMSLKYMGPKMMHKIISEQERRDFGWTERDLATACESALSMNQKTAKCGGIEVEVGVSKAWQQHVCDEFAAVMQQRSQSGGTTVPIVIHVSLQDKLSRLESIDWIQKRCYADSKIVVEHQIHKHEVMTIMGGPPHNPVLLLKIVKAWGLLHQPAN